MQFCNELLKFLEYLYLESNYNSNASLDKILKTYLQLSLNTEIIK